MFRKALMTTATAVCAATLFAGSAAPDSNYGKSSGQSHTSTQRPFANIPEAVWNRHVGWCSSRFKSYRWRDNSYQPYSGPRKQCWSPHITASH